MARFPAENPNPVLRLSQDGIILYANEASRVLLREWGCGVTDPVPPTWRDWVAEFFAKRVTKTVDVPCDGLVYSFDIVPITEAGYVNLYGRDITARKRVEEIIQLRLRLFEFAATYSLAALMQKALDEIGRITGSPIGFYHFVEADQKTLSLQAWSTRTVQEFCQAEGRGSHYNLDEAGVWVDCVYQRKPVIHNNYASLPHRKGMPAGHAEVIRELVVPIMREGRVVAILGIGNKSSDYDEKDVEFVLYIADVVWEIVERKRAEEALQQANTQLHDQNEELQAQAEELEAQTEELHAQAEELQAQTFQLEAERSRLATIIDSVPDAILVADERGQVVLANPAAKYLYPQAQGRLEHFGKITRYYPDHTPYKPDDLPLFRAAVHGETHRNIPMALLWPDGQWRDILVSAVPILDSRDQAHGAVGVYQDITEIKQTEEALRESEQKLTTLFELLPIGVSVLDADNEVVYMNPALTKNLDISQEGLLRGDYRERTYLRPDGAPMPADEFASSRAIREQQAVHNIETGVMKEDSQVVWMNVSAAPLTFSDWRVIVVTDDITARKQAEAQIKVALAEKEVLLQEIHHRVKNNLQVLVHLIDMQIEATKNPEVLQMFRALQQRIQTMAMVHAKLYQAQDLGRIDFGDYLRDLTTYLYESLASHSNIALSVEADEVFINLNMANPCGLIVNELVTNALKYAFSTRRRDAKQGEAGNEIRVGFRLDKGEYVLTVSDNGVGLPPGFDWRATESLGLKLVNILAEYQLRGRVEVDTEPDSAHTRSEPMVVSQKQAGLSKSGRTKGTTFTIRFAEKRK